MLKIIKDSLMVMNGLLKHIKLYVLEGSIVIGDANVTSSLLDLENIKLWHMHLDYMSENSLVKLSKKGMIDCRISKLKCYEHYIFRKPKRVSFNAGTHNIKGTLDYIYLDL